MSVLLFQSIQAQDTLYIYKNGVVDFKQALSDVDSLSMLNSNNPDILDRLAKDGSFSLFYQAMVATGYAERIRNSPLEDKTYNPLNCSWYVKTYNISEEIPTYRKFGYTLLMESNATLANYKDCPLCPGGIQNLDDLELLAKYWYSSVYNGLFEDGLGVIDRKDSCNFLNRYVAYHLLGQKFPASRFINDFDTPHQIKTYDMEEYKESLLQNTLIQVKKDRKNNQAFYLNMYETANPSSAVQLKGAAFIGRNGFAYELDKPLVYSKMVNDYLSSTRLRMDVASFFHEFASNNLRGTNPSAENVAGKAHRYIIPSGYCDRMSFTNRTRMTYLNANGIYEDFQGDELYVEGPYDFTITTLPIPAGTYEIRLGYQPTDWRGNAQVYVDSIPNGPPTNFALLSNNPLIGWVAPGSDPKDPFGYANDSLMRTKGYMKGPSSYKCTIGLYYDPTKTARTSNKTLRKILGTYTFAKAGTHSIRIQCTGSSVGDTQFMVDYFEFVPLEYLKKEGVD